MACFKFLCLFLLTSTVLLADDLPGIVDLSCGFDSLRMIGTNEISSGDQLKFRIFDMDEFSSKPFHLDMDGKIQKFTTPAMVQVSNLRMRSDQTVESVSKSFTQFFHSYFSSNKFEISIPIPTGSLPLEITFGIHKTVRDAYEFMKTKYGAVATSTSWWGMYSIQMAPVYTMKLDPLFNRSLSRLVPKPNTEREQWYYNQIVSTYGTHYISSVIMGGVAHIYRFISQEWLKQNSQHSIETQVSIGVKYTGFGGQYENGGGSVVSIQTEEFLKNSVSKSVFSPAVSSLLSDSPATSWKEWVKTIARQPVVVNRTLFSLSSLLMEHPVTVAEHLQKTIDYYLMTGRLPKLSDFPERRSEIMSVPVTPIPGIDVVGCGYDIMNLKSKLCLFELTYNDNRSWTDIYNGMKTYSTPDGYFVQGSRELYSTYDTTFFNSYSEFIQNSVYESAHDSSGFLGFGASYKRTGIITRLRNIYEYHLNLAWTKRQVSWYKLSMVTFPRIPLNFQTTRALDGLPMTFDPKLLNIWDSFFDSYGTHYVVNALLGGMIWAEDYFESCMITKYSYKWIREQIKRSYLFISFNYYNEIVTSTMNTEYQKYRTSKLLVIGGNFDSSIPNSTAQMKAWMNSLKNSPRPITYQLRPIYTLLPKNSPKRQALEEATLYFRKKAVEETNLYIDRLKMLETPPPVPKMNCTQLERQRRNVK